jgi:hypothetical protein
MSLCMIIRGKRRAWLQITISYKVTGMICRKSKIVSERTDPWNGQLYYDQKNEWFFTEKGLNLQMKKDLQTDKDRFLKISRLSIHKDWPANLIQRNKHQHIYGLLKIHLHLSYFRFVLCLWGNCQMERSGTTLGWVQWLLLAIFMFSLGESMRRRCKTVIKSSLWKLVS